MSRSSTKTDSVASAEIRRSITDARKHQPQSVMLQQDPHSHINHLPVTSLAMPGNFSLQLLQNAGY